MKNLLCIIAFAIINFHAIAQQPGNFGTKEIGLVNFKGDIYYLLNNIQRMPAYIDKMKSQGVIYTKSFDIPRRHFTEGFPGVTSRFEWFGILYTGTFEVSIPGNYKWFLSSDDGSKLWIDDYLIIENDGMHSFKSVDGEAELIKGRHSMRLWYFQGPATGIGLQLFVTPPGGVRKIFNLDDYSPGITEALKKVNAVPTPDGIKIPLPDNIHFDVGKLIINASAKEALALVAEVIRSYPGSTVNIHGHTDATGSKESNQKLSEDRAMSVLSALKKLGIPEDIKLNALGFGQDKPVAGNDTEKGRAQNRRVELFIVK